jgi:hypothetical protein
MPARRLRANSRRSAAREHYSIKPSAQRGLFQKWRARCFGSLEIDDEIEFSRLFDWKIARLRPVQNLIGIVSWAPE